ncbi:hypothetical protein [Rahnella selenatireducens]|uniref:hypothetical protein n=1 Tax=Rahnella selenatireducens TaxID=3389797 RepID=UPI003968DF3E
MDQDSAAQLTEDFNALWIPSEYPEWIDFSIAKSDEGFFIVSNLSGDVKNTVFNCIELAFTELDINYSIEEV